MHKKRWPHCLCSLTVLFWSSFVCFDMFLSRFFCFWLLVGNTLVIWSWLYSFPFVCGFCCRFVVMLFYSAKTRRWHACQNITFTAYWEPPIPSFRAPPTPYYVTVFIHTIRVHSFTYGLVYVPVASVHVCVLVMFACWRVVSMCVCRLPWCINVCVRGIRL